MREMIVAKRDQIDDTLDSKPKQRNTDLLSNLIESARGVQDFVEDQSTGSGKIGLDGFSDDEIMGNAFLVIMAGHETTAGTLHIALLLLAMNVGSQRRLQNEVDSLFGGRTPSDWNYDHDFSSASNGMLGAVVSETLRWMPPVSAIPKWTPEEQPLNVNGVGCTVPKNTMIALNVPAAHRNPNQWPHGKPGRPHDLEYAPSNPDDDLGEFKPERWLPSSSNNAGSYRPERGAYLPFSEGSRICIGRRFTQVEMVALLAVIFQNYSVELAVDEWANDAEVERMDEDLRHEVWSKARASSKWKLRTKMTFLMTNRMNNEHVPLRFVRRGKERFAAEQW
jgi:cytochrome P450